MLGISAHTLRRRIRDGVIQAQRVERPQGYAWVVYLEQVPAAVTSEQPAEQTSHDPAAGSDVTSDDPAPHRAEAAGSAGNHVADSQQLALALAPLIEASVNAAVAPLRAELADVRALLSTRDQELGAALERIRGLETARSDSPEMRVGSPSANGTVEPTGGRTSPNRPRLPQKRRHSARGGCAGCQRDAAQQWR